MNCETDLYLIDELIEGELDERTAGQVTAHIHNCPNCSAYYKMLEQEQTMYSQYLYNVEPPADLQAKFQVRMAEEIPAVLSVQEVSSTSGWRDYFSGFFRLIPAFGLAALLLIFGIGIVRVVMMRDETTTSRIQPNTQQTASTTNGNEQAATTSKAVETIAPIVETAIPVKAVKKDTDNKLTASKLVIKDTKVIPVKAAKANVKVSQPNKAEQAVTTPQPTEEEVEAELIALNKETGKQIESVEMLLRSFRNARVVEGSVIYDVDYEKQQARRLLEKNVILRQVAEVYGTPETEDILERVEPFLLDIANLDSKPTEEKILDIKERVKNQNIIASLQSY